MRMERRSRLASAVVHFPPPLPVYASVIGNKHALRYDQQVGPWSGFIFLIEWLLLPTPANSSRRCRKRSLLRCREERLAAPRLSNGSSPTCSSSATTSLQDPDSPPTEYLFKNEIVLFGHSRRSIRTSRRLRTAEGPTTSETKDAVSDLPLEEDEGFKKVRRRGVAGAVASLAQNDDEDD
jgi:hypothetical protein